MSSVTDRVKERSERVRRRLRDCMTDSYAMREKAARCADMQNKVHASPHKPAEPYVFQKSYKSMQADAYPILQYERPESSLSAGRNKDTLRRTMFDEYGINKTYESLPKPAPYGFQASLMPQLEVNFADDDITLSKCILSPVNIQNTCSKALVKRFPEKTLKVVSALQIYAQKSASDCSVSILAQSIRNIIPLLGEEADYRNSTSLLTLSMLKEMLRTRNGTKVSNYKDFLLSLNAYHCILFHQSIKKHSRPVSQREHGNYRAEIVSPQYLEIANMVSSYLRESVGGTLNDLLRTFCSAFEVQSRIDEVCERVLLRHENPGLHGEWIRLFYSLRAGRLDIAVTENANFEGIEPVQTHIAEMLKQTDFYKFDAGSEEIANILHSEIAGVVEIKDADPFKIAVLLVLSQSRATHEDTSASLQLLSQSPIFCESHDTNFLWVALFFESHISPEYFMKSVFWFGVDSQIEQYSDAASILCDPFADIRSGPVDNLRLLGNTIHLRLQKFASDQELVLCTLFFDVLIYPEKPEKALWRSHILAVQSAINESNQNFSQAGTENALIQSLKSVLTPIKYVLNGDENAVDKTPLSPVRYCLEILGLFDAEFRSELLIAMLQAQVAQISSPASHMQGGDFMKAFISTLFREMMDPKEDVSSTADSYAEKLRFVDYVAKQAQAQGLTSIFLQLCCEVYVHLKETKQIDCEQAKGLLSVAIGHLEKEIVDHDLQNTNGIIDMALVLRDSLKADAERATAGAHKSFVLFVSSVEIYRSLCESVKRHLPQSSNLKDSSHSEFLLDIDIALFARLGEPSAMSEILRAFCDKFERMNVDIQESASTGVALSEATTEALRAGCHLLLKIIKAIKNVALAYNIRSEDDVHAKCARFVAWSRGFAEAANDSLILKLSLDLESEFHSN